MTTFQEYGRAADPRDEIMTAARADDIARSDELMHAVDRLKQNLLLADKIRAVSGMQTLELRLIERQELLDAAALSDVAKLEAIPAAIDLFKFHAPELREAAGNHMLLAAGDARHMNLEAPPVLAHQQRLLMPAAGTAKREAFRAKEIRHIMHMNLAAALTIERHGTNDATDEHNRSSPSPRTFLKKCQIFLFAETLRRRKEKSFLPSDHPLH